jgi:hypothetical protein
MPDTADHCPGDIAFLEMIRWQATSRAEFEASAPDGRRRPGTFAGLSLSAIRIPHDNTRRNRAAPDGTDET